MVGVKPLLGGVDSATDKLLPAEDTTEVHSETITYSRNGQSR